MKKVLLFLSCMFVFETSSLASGFNLSDVKSYLRSDVGITYSETSVMGYDVSGFQGMYNFALGAQKDRIRAELVFQERATLNKGQKQKQSKKFHFHKINSLFNTTRKAL